VAEQGYENRDRFDPAYARQAIRHDSTRHRHVSMNGFVG
jgi:hypothetical protein